MIRDIDLSSKEAYLNWVQEWKGYWKATVEEIRFVKERRKYHRDRGRQFRKYGSQYSYPEWAQHHYRYMEFYDDYREHLRERARFLHELRIEGKKLSWEAKQKQLQEVT